MRHALIALVALATTVQAGTPQVLRFSGADLDSPQAVAHTYRRLQTGAELACEAYQGRELARQRVFQECVARTVADTVARIQSPTLTAYHARQRGETLRTAAGYWMSAATTRQK